MPKKKIRKPRKKLPRLCSECAYDMGLERRQYKQITIEACTKQDPNHKNAPYVRSSAIQRALTQQG